MLNSGEFDGGFRPDTDVRAQDIAVTDQGDLIIGGSFTRAAGITRNNLARFDSTGNLDLGFDPNVNRTVHEILLDKQNGNETGSMFLGGFFSTVGGYSQGGLAKLDQSGNVDLTFSAEVNNSIRFLAQSPVQPIDLVVGGTFTQVNAGPYSGLVGIDAAGNAVDTFEALTDIRTNSGIVQDDGSIVAGINAQVTVNRLEYSLEKRDPNGVSGSGFKILLDNAVDAILIQPDGKILAAGLFTEADGEQVRQIIRVENTVEDLVAIEDELCFPIVSQRNIAVVCL